jgi:hypothetical protein
VVLLCLHVNDPTILELEAMASSSPALLDLPLEMLTRVCQELDLSDLVRVAGTCKRFCHGDGGLVETLELPTKSPVVTALLERSCLRPELATSTRPSGCAESWLAYLPRCARQRRCRDAPPIAAGYHRSVFVTPAGRLLAYGEGFAAGHDDADGIHSDPKLWPPWLFLGCGAWRRGLSTASPSAGMAASTLGGVTPSVSLVTATRSPGRRRC